MQRREFLAGAAVTAVGAVSGVAASRTAIETGGTPVSSELSGRAAKRFKCAYAPHFGMLRNLAGDDPVSQLDYAGDQGFWAWEDNGMSGRSVDEQKRIADAMSRLDMRMGVFVCNPATAWEFSFTRRDKGMREKFLNEVRQSVEVAKRVNATWMTVVPGRADEKLHPELQLAYTIEQLRLAADILEPHGLVMVLEPLNPYRDHPGQMLARSTQAYAVCKGVNSPACKILFDIYHQQITEGNLIPNIDSCWDEIAYFQIGDNPGRNEPTTGEINYRNVFRHIHRRGYTGILGMEHGVSRSGAEGEQALIDAYRWSDAFDD